MATTVVVSCPECGKQTKAPAEFLGKKVRCKACGTAFTAAAPRAAARPPAAAPAAHRPPPPPEEEPPRRDDEDDNDPGPYKVGGADMTPRCPECANEMESEDAVVCLHCGYNTQTRERVTTRKVADVTPGDRILWLLPAILCVIGIIFLLTFDIIYCARMSDWARDQWYEFLASGPAKLWLVIISLFATFFAGKFAVKRLIFHPNPPEVEL
jgi:hypothetical protein